MTLSFGAITNSLAGNKDSSKEGLIIINEKRAWSCLAFFNDPFIQCCHVGNQWETFGEHCWWSRERIFSHRHSISPIFPIGRVVRILLRTQKKEWKRKLRPNMVMLIIMLIIIIIIAGSNCCPACSRRRCYLAKRTAAASFFLLFAFYSFLLMINDN